MRLKPLASQTIVITGATSGIGLATAERAARAGARLVLAARNGEALEAVAERLRGRNPGMAVVTAVTDVADPDAVLRLRDTAIERFGGFDSWVNDAAAAVYGTLTEIPLADHRQVFDIGYFGLVQGSLAAATHLRGKGGAIVNLGSILSERSIIYQGPYCAMKHAVKGFTDALRMELEAERAGISVTLIKPAGINTPYPEHARNYLDAPARIPPVLYDPQLVAKAILHACVTPARELTVGGAGLAIELGGKLFPRATDLFLERFGKSIQTIRKPPPRARVDNLYEPRADGAAESDQPVHTRRTSLYLEAQLRPMLAAGALALAGGLVAARVAAAGARAISRRV